MDARRGRSLVAGVLLASMTAGGAALALNQGPQARLTEPAPTQTTAAMEREPFNSTVVAGRALVSREPLMVTETVAPRGMGLPAVSAIPAGQAVPAQESAPGEDTDVLRRPASVRTEQAVPGVSNVAPGRLLSMPLQGRKTSRFGMRFHPVLRYTKLHTGLDLAAPCGTPVGASAPGVVTRAGWAGGNGVQVRVDHGMIAGHHVVTTYNHLSSIGVRVGQRVATHQGVGRVGNTGYSTGCHLHFEVIVNGRYTDPEPWLNGQPVIVDASTMNQVPVGVPAPVASAVPVPGATPNPGATQPGATVPPVPGAPSVPAEGGNLTPPPANPGQIPVPEATLTTTPRPTAPSVRPTPSVKPKPSTTPSPSASKKPQPSVAPSATVPEAPSPAPTATQGPEPVKPPVDPEAGAPVPAAPEAQPQP